MIWQTKSVATATALLGAAPTLAAELRVEIGGLRNASGPVHVAVRTGDAILRPACGHFGSAPATSGAVTVRGVPPGRYTEPEPGATVRLTLRDVQ